MHLPTEPGAALRDEPPPLLYHTDEVELRLSFFSLFFLLSFFFPWLTGKPWRSEGGVHRGGREEEEDLHEESLVGVDIWFASKAWKILQEVYSILSEASGYIDLYERVQRLRVDGDVLGLHVLEYVPGVPNVGASLVVADARESHGRSEDTD